jgi:hypothetical protein
MISEWLIIANGAKHLGIPGSQFTGKGEQSG